MKLLPKQTIALDFLEDTLTNEVFYGGAAGGGKSALGCYWQLKNRLLYPGSRGLMAREELKTLKETTLATFFEICQRQGVIRGTHFDLTSSNHAEYPGCIVFANGSVIYLKELFEYPTDPDFHELGSLEITDAFVDESPQITVKAKNILRSRIRYKLNEFGLIPKLLLCGNPSKNWPYFEFYKPSKINQMPPDKQFVQALPGDNSNLPESYLKSLANLDKNSRERLLYGNWEYDDDPASLINYDAVMAMFSNGFIEEGERYITADIARYGSDKTVIVVWSGFRAKIFSFSKLSVPESASMIESLRMKYKVPITNVIADEDGIGGGVVDLIGCSGFVNNSTALNDENYQNLKSQCYYKLAEMINGNKLFVQADENIGDIVEELEAVKQFRMDKDGKKAVLPKDQVKSIIGRSPDFADALMMRMYFEYDQPVNWMPQ